VRGKPISKELRVNDRIRAREVRVIAEDGEQFGVMPIFEALRQAQELGVDLVEVAPTAVPPVCRLLDYGKYRFEQDKKERDARKNQKVALLKEVRMGPATDDHDLTFKAKMIQKFIEEGDKVKVTLRFRGRELDTAGDGFFAAFDGPARAVLCARAVQNALRPLELQIRAGLHTGECEVSGDKVAGIAVAIGARIAALARPGDVLVSRTVKDLVAGSGIEFDDRGEHELKGVPGEWRLYALKDG